LSKAAAQLLRSGGSFTAQHFALADSWNAGLAVLWGRSILICHAEAETRRYPSSKLL